MTGVKPWEPVKVQYFDRAESWLGYNWTFDDGDWDTISKNSSDWESRVTLANGQRIIVRALSEERKQARAFDKRVKKAIEANR